MWKEMKKTTESVGQTTDHYIKYSTEQKNNHTARKTFHVGLAPSARSADSPSFLCLTVFNCNAEQKRVKGKSWEKSHFY